MDQLREPGVGRAFDGHVIIAGRLGSGGTQVLPGRVELDAHPGAGQGTAPKDTDLTPFGARKFHLDVQRASSHQFAQVPSFHGAAQDSRQVFIRSAAPSQGIVKVKKLS